MTKTVTNKLVVKPENPSPVMPVDLRLASAMKTFSEAASVFIFFVGVLVLIGWKFNIAILTGAFSSFVPMAPTSAIGAIFLGVSLWLLQDKRPKKWMHNFGKGCALLVLALGIATFIEYVVGHSLSIDELFFRWLDEVGLKINFAKMALSSVFVFISFGLSVLFLDVETKRGTRPAQFFALLGGFISMVAIIGYIHNVASFYQSLEISPAISLYSAIVFFIFHFGILLARPERGFIRLLVVNSFAGRMARIFLPCIFIIPLIIGWVVEFGEHSGLYTFGFNVGLETLINIITLSLVVAAGIGLLKKQEEEKTKVDMALLKSEGVYHELINVMDEGLGVQDKNGIITFLNRRACEILDYKLEELVGKPATFLFDKENQKILREQMVKRRRGERESFEIAWLCKGGKKIDTIISPSPIFDEKGDFAGSVAVFTDITTRKKAELELKNEQLISSTIMDNFPGTFAMISQKGETARWNKGLESFYGYTKEELTPLTTEKALSLFYTKENADKVIKAMETTFREGRVQIELDNLVDRGRSQATCLFTAIRIEINKELYIIVWGVDISNIKKAENDLKKEKEIAELLAIDLEKFKLAVDNESDHVMITDKNGIILYVNKAAEIITGYTAKEIIGKNAGQLWGGNMPKEFYEKMWYAVKTEKKVFTGELINHRKDGQPDTFIGEVTNRKKNGQPYTAEVRIAPILDDKGEVQFFVGVERDITNVKEIDQMKTDFISFTSHQLRTPLTVMNWNTEMLRNGDAGELTREQKRYLTEIERGEKRMVQLINSLLNISRLESEKIKIEPKPTDILLLISNAISDLSSCANAKNCTIKFNKPSKKPPLIDLDPVLFGQIVTNLLSNATRYSKPQKCHVDVDFKEIAGYYQVDVIDEGIGIPAKAQDKIFNKFFRADNAIQAETEGTGLGLYITKLIIETIGGKVWFESAENKGSVFHFTIPKGGMEKTAGEKKLSV